MHLENYCYFLKTINGHIRTLSSSIGDGLHYPMRNADEESGRLLDGNGCPAANPSSESTPQFASEESVPMMLHTATETEVGTGYTCLQQRQ